MNTKKNLKQLPKYRIKASDLDKSSLSFVSLVKKPAIKVQAQYFSEGDTDFEPQQFFKAAEGDKQVIVGPAMIAGMNIYRRSPSGFEYVVEFTPDVIECLVMKFFRDNGNTAINFDHSDRVVKGYIFEASFVRNSTYSAAKAYGYDLSIGSWFIGVKIDDAEIWQVVKDEGGLSFSVEGMLDQILVNMSEDEMDLYHESFGDQGKYTNSTPPCHPKCKCEIQGNTWKVHKDPINGYPCKLCADNRKVWLRENANKPGSRSFTNQDMETIDFVWNEIEKKLIEDLYKKYK